MVIVAMHAANPDYEVSLHRVGCADIARRERRGATYQGEIDRYASVQDAMDALVDTGDPADPGYLEAEIKINGCCSE